MNLRGRLKKCPEKDKAVRILMNKILNKESERHFKGFLFTLIEETISKKTSLKT